MDLRSVSDHSVSQYCHLRSFRGFTSKLESSNDGSSHEVQESIISLCRVSLQYSIFLKPFLGIEASGFRKGVWTWHGYMQLVWTRRSPNVPAQVLKGVEEKVMVKGASSRALTKSRMTGMPGLNETVRSSNVAKEFAQTDGLFPRRAALGERYWHQLTSAGAFSLSQAAANAHAPDTSNSRHEGDDTGEVNEENQYDEVAGRTTSSQQTSTLENSNLSSTGSTQRWFPYDDCFKLDDQKTLTSSEVISMLSPFLADERKQRIEKVVANRTYSVCIAVEGLLDLGNVSAVFRTADALGFQSVHVISNETKKKYKKNRKVSMGTEKWLDAEMWENSSDCIATLRKRGYRIAVTHIAPDTVSIHDMDWTLPTAIFFGNEFKGASEEAIEQSDIRCCIPMGGMVESFNVSVAAGIVMHHAARDRITRFGTHGDISSQDRKILEAEFCLRHDRHTLPVLDRLLRKKPKAPDAPSNRIFSDDFLDGLEEPDETGEPEGLQM